MSAGGLALLAAVLAVAGALALLGARPALPPPPGSGAVPPGPGAGAGSVGEPPDGLLRRGRAVWALLAGAGAGVVLGGPLAVPIGLAASGMVWVVAGRLEPPGARRRREQVRRDLPHLVSLLGAALRAGLAPPQALGVVGRALPGPAADRLAPLAARLELGGDAAAIWSSLGGDPELGPLGRALARAHRTGAPVVAVIDRLADELAHRGRAEVEDRARAVGVRAAVPLGLCLLPSFLLLGIVPLAVSLASTIG
ncbi:type II secretion system F family protein [Nocardioides sp. zg-536]|uniref:Type II secretion system F family protein n=1 Tax=Nocardioides faecalis TaxID=2803858 RepID=A0A938Y2T9_9ACTN|nr:type II secretion system F family protein [Nocardioides faecalis]MBM9461147.1 type II secretion system F family protein [Nocardioides faecalis]MBS4752199.1 type II secretion system F family protein [Nocardioides faecalis]QVI59000.1 type II secretion system F family protein [Nocardioides faecalis]